MPSLKIFQKYSFNKFAHGYSTFTFTRPLSSAIKTTSVFKTVPLGFEGSTYVNKSFPVDETGIIFNGFSPFAITCLHIFIYSLNFSSKP